MPSPNTSALTDVRGADAVRKPRGEAPRRQSRRASGSTIYQRLCDLISQEPGQTADQLSFRLFGKPGMRSSIAFECQLLMTRGLVERTGEGGRRDPFLYWAARAGPGMGRHAERLD